MIKTTELSSIIDPVYLIYYWEERNNITTVNVQWSDLKDYNIKHFVKNKNGQYYYHEDEKVVADFILEKYNTSEIDIDILERFGDINENGIKLVI